MRDRHPRRAAFVRVPGPRAPERAPAAAPPPAAAAALPAPAAAAALPAPAAAAALPAPAAPGVPEPPLVDTPLVVTVDGKPVRIAGAVAATAGGAATHLVLSNRPLSCDATRRDWQRVAPGQVLIHLTVAPLLLERTGHAYRPGGAVRVRSASWPGGMEVSASGRAEVPPGAAQAGAKARVRLAYDGSFPALGRRAASSLTVRGAIVVRGCGDRPPAGTPRPQPDLTLAVAGQPFPVLGATLTTDEEGVRTLRLTSGPQSCPAAFFDAPWDVSVELRFGGSARLPQVTLGGARLPSDAAYVGPDVAVRATLVEGADEVEVTLGPEPRWSWPLVLHGRVVARRCADPHAARAR
jgi:hypothetical protein